jgi:hypothetical protein
MLSSRKQAGFFFFLSKLIRILNVCKAEFQERQVAVVNKERCGVGVTFIEDEEGALVVKSLVPGGPAAMSANVMVIEQFQKNKIAMQIHVCIRAHTDAWLKLFPDLGTDGPAARCVYDFMPPPKKK